MSSTKKLNQYLKHLNLRHAINPLPPKLGKDSIIPSPSSTNLPIKHTWVQEGYLVLLLSSSLTFCPHTLKPKKPLEKTTLCISITCV